MATEPAMSGEIPPDGVLDILREIEARRITGRLRFTATSEDGTKLTGEVELIAGQIALDQDPLPDGSDPVERLLAMRGGIFVVHQRLPVLPVSQGDDRHRVGSLSVHVPADLMNYCEQAGLTGTLKLDHEGERVELVYEAGELLAIRVDGREDGDLTHVFGWDSGRFEIAVNAKVRTLIPELPAEEARKALESDDFEAREPTTQYVRPRNPEDTGKHLMKVLEVALTTIVDQSERARPARVSPARGASKSVRPRPATMPALNAPRRREPTVRVVYLKPDDPTTAVPAGTDLSTRHVAPGHAREEALPEAQPARRKSAEHAAVEPAKPPPLRPVRKDPTPTPTPQSEPPRTAKPDRTPLRVEQPPRSSPSHRIALERETERAKHQGLTPLLWVITVVAIGLLVVGLLTQLQ
ncbi:hypothetical protein [Sandaracinus amylolyticus]|nr:hypothetical protein [Sandaracinus amylolyticus]